MITLRDYQEEAVETVVENYKNQVTSQLISLPTGGGKTIVFTEIAKRLNKPTLVIAHREELLDQASQKFGMVWPEASVGLIRGAINDHQNKDVVISSVQTLSREKRLNQIPKDRFGLLICDEAHHSGAETYKKVFSQLGFMSDDPDKLLLGVTATPMRGDKICLSSIYKKTVFQRSIIWMIKKGYLVDLKGLTVETKHDMSKVKLQKGDYSESSLASILNTANRNEVVAKTFIKKAKGKKAICFAIDVQHVFDLASTFNALGIKAAPIWGNMKPEDRKETLQSFHHGEIQVLVNCGVLTEGYDEPAVDCIIMARPTRSKILYLQMLGRGLRLFPGKKECLIIDFADNTTKHNDAFRLPAVFGIDMGDASLLEAVRARDIEIAEREKTEKGVLPSVSDEDIETIDTDIFERSKFNWTVVGDIMRLPAGKREYLYLQQEGEFYQVIYQTPKGSKALTERPLDIGYAQGYAEEFIRRSGRMTLVSKEAAWRAKKASKGQVDLMKKLNIYEPDLTAGLASDAIEEFFAMKELRKKQARGC